MGRSIVHRMNPFSPSAVLCFTPPSKLSSFQLCHTETYALQTTMHRPVEKSSFFSSLLIIIFVFHIQKKPLEYSLRKWKQAGRTLFFFLRSAREPPLVTLVRIMIIMCVSFLGTA